MKITRVLLPFALSMASLALAQDVTGDWHGTLRVNGAELRLVLHISKNSDGSLKATLDSIDQNANGIPVTSATLTGSALRLKVDAVQGPYEGDVNAAGSEIAGTWTQDARLELTFYRRGIHGQASAKAAKPSNIDGDWLGTIDTGMGTLRLVLHIHNTDQGLAATVDSPDQNAKGLPVTSIILSGTSLKFEMKEIGGAYAGNISSDLDTLTGTWTQLDKSLPLAFKRVKSTVELDRPGPQNPFRPGEARVSAISAKRSSFYISEQSDRQSVSATSALNHNSVHAEGPSGRFEGRNTFRFNERSHFWPEITEPALLSGAVIVQQVS